MKRAVDKNIYLRHGSERDWNLGIEGGGNINYILSKISSNEEYLLFNEGGDFNISKPSDSKGNVVIKDYNFTSLVTLNNGEKIKLLVQNDKDNRWRVIYVDGGTTPNDYTKDFQDVKIVEIKHYLDRIPEVMVIKKNKKKLTDALITFTPSDMKNKLTVTFARKQSGKIICQ